MAETGTDPPDSLVRDSRRLPRWWPLTVAVLVMIAVLWVLLTAWGAVQASHPAGWATLIASGGGSLAVIAWSVLVGPAPERHRWVRWAFRVVLIALGSVVVVGNVYVRPLSAEQVAIDALEDGDGVTISESSRQIRMKPSSPARSGLVFYPGGKVDPRAYTRVLRPVAEAGYEVVISKQPYNLAVLDIGAADAVIGRSDDAIEAWVVGGHSLGGAMSSSYAETDRDELVGLLLYAAFPVNDMSNRTDLVITSISGTRDGLADVDDIAESVDDLPGTTRFVAVDGAIHSFFGDYGQQRGDGTPTISREEAQTEIIAATLDLMDSIDTSTP